MNVSDYVSDSDIRYTLTDLAHTYKVQGGSLLDRDYPFVVGYVRETANGSITAADPDDEGVLYVRDSIYDGGAEEPSYSYGDQYNFTDKYSKRIVELSYDWVVYLGNHAYSMQRLSED